MVTFMKKLRNERGIALVTSLLLMLIALAITMTLFYVITWQTKLSAAHKRYKTAIEASQGGAEIFARQIIPNVFANVTGSRLTAAFPGISLVQPSGGPCLKYKLDNGTASWGGSVCGTDTNLFNPTTKPDIKLTLQGTNSNFDVYAKIVDTMPGNSDLSGFDMLDGGAGVTGTSTAVAPKHIPALYRIEVLGQKEINPEEKAKLSVLYAY